MAIFTFTSSLAMRNADAVISNLEGSISASAYGDIDDGDYASDGDTVTVGPQWGSYRASAYALATFVPRLPMNI